MVYKDQAHKVAQAATLFFGLLGKSFFEIVRKSESQGFFVFQGFLQSCGNHCATETKPPATATSKFLKTIATCHNHHSKKAKYDLPHFLL